MLVVLLNSMNTKLLTESIFKQNSVSASAKATFCIYLFNYFYGLNRTHFTHLSDYLQVIFFKKKYSDDIDITNIQTNSPIAVIISEQGFPTAFP